MQIIFPLTSLQQCTAVTDIYFIIRKVWPYLLNCRWGGREEGGKHIQEWVLKLKPRTGAPENRHRRHPPKRQRLSFPRGEQEGRVVPAPPSISILGSRWHPGTRELSLSLTGYSQSWKLQHYKKKKNFRSSCSHCGAGRWDQRAAENPREGVPLLSPDNFLIS